MFYRLLTIDGRLLPTDIVIDGTSYPVTRGGLLLEPPGESSAGNAIPEGRSVLRLFGLLRSEAVELLAGSAESYRWRSPDELDISCVDSPLGARFCGRRSGEHLELIAEPGGRFIARSTRLGFAAAPYDEITDDWRDTFDFGPPSVQTADPSLRNNPDIQATIAEMIRVSEPARRQTAITRLENAWHAPV